MLYLIMTFHVICILVRLISLHVINYNVMEFLTTLDMVRIKNEM